MSTSEDVPQLQTALPARRRALITGAGRRIGREIALTLARSGIDTVISYKHSAEEASATVKDIEALGVRGLAVRCDLYDPASIEAAVLAAASWGSSGGSSGGTSGSGFGSGAEAPALDILVNNAGAFETAVLEALSPEQWDAMFSTNTRAPLLAAQAALPFLRASPGTGRIINIGSLGGLHPWATHAHYCASKAAVHMLTQTMAKAWAPQVAVNCVAPGMIVTGGEAGEGYRHFAAKTPMGRNGSAADIAEVVLFLASATPFLTGQIIAVDGGLGL